MARPIRRRRVDSLPQTGWASILLSMGRLSWYSRLFYFYIFRKHFLQKYIFNITIYSFVPLPPGRGRQGACLPSAGRQGLICKLKKIICAEALGGSLPPPCRQSTGRQGACRPAGGRQAPPSCIKGFPSPSPPHLLPTTSRVRSKAIVSCAVSIASSRTS